MSQLRRSSAPAAFGAHDLPLANRRLRNGCGYAVVPRVPEIAPFRRLLSVTRERAIFGHPKQALYQAEPRPEPRNSAAFSHFAVSTK